MSNLARSIAASVAVVSLAVAAAATTSTTSYAEDQPPGVSQEPATEAELEAAEVSRGQLLDLLEEGLTPSEAAGQLGWEVIFDNPQFDYSDPDDIGLMSSNGDVYVTAPSVVYDPYKNLYVATSYFGWNNTRWASDCPEPLFGSSGSVTARDCGGYDAIGIRSSRSVNDYGKTARIYSSVWDGPKPHPGGTAYEGNKPRVYPGYWDNSSAGASFRYQDRRYLGYCGISGDGGRWCKKYLGYNGSVVWSFKVFSTNCHQFYSRVAHTWPGAQITGFSVSTTGFGMSWSGDGDYWQKTSGAGKLRCA